MSDKTTIGQRAAQAIKEKSKEYETSFRFECDLIGIHDTSMRAWRNGKENPSAKALASMHRMGYDVIYILTGEDNGKRI